MLKKAIFALAVLSSTASAETLICPIGGERFAAPAIAQCDETGTETMLLMPVGCPPATMPQCPQNFLPMYRAFGEAELPLLRQYMQSESYESNVDFSRYYLAYIVEKHLNGPMPQLPAMLLLRGLWEDPSLITNDPAYMSALRGEMEGLLHADAPNYSAQILTMLGFTQFLAGDLPATNVYLDRAESLSPKGAKARRYLNAVRACLVDSSMPFCSPTALIPKI